MSCRLNETPFTLGCCLLGWSIETWRAPRTGSIRDEWMSADMFIDLARLSERGCFDYVLLNDLRRRALLDADDRSPKRHESKVT
jgi:hypothetical protein